jgi:hypothetical protein
LIPPSIHQGTAKIAGSHAENEYILVAVDVGVYNVRKATCQNGCTTCEGYTGYNVTVDGFAVPVKGTQQETATGTYETGTQYNLTAGSTWTSSNTSIYTVSAGLVKGVAVGNATTTGTESLPITMQACNEQDCESSGFFQTVPGTVPAQPTITSISPGSGQSGATVPVQINGSNFGSNAGALSISGISAGQISVNSGGTQINTSFNLAGLTPGSYSVVVNLSLGDNVALPSNSSPFTVNAIQVTTAEVTVIGWLNASVISLPSGENSGLQAALTYKSPGCTALLLLWSSGTASLIDGQADINYANAELNNGVYCTG